MYGSGSGPITSAATGTSGVASTVAGIAVLPNTGGNLALTILGVATLVLGVLVTTSFVVTLVLARRYN